MIFPSLMQDVAIDETDQQFIAQCNEIAPGLWLGSLPDSLDPGFKYVLSLCGSTANVAPHQRKIVTYFSDSLELPPVPYLYSLADLALGLWKDGPILIHCAAGLNRSGLIMGLMLVRSGQMTAQEAIDAMRQKRSQAVLFNTTFRNWLLTQTG